MKKLLNYILTESENAEFDFKPFIAFATKHLKLDEEPKIDIVDVIEGLTAFGCHNLMDRSITVAKGGRHQIDVMRTIAHEMVHYKQSATYTPDGQTGSDDENEANAVAGIILRDYAQTAFND